MGSVIDYINCPECSYDGCFVDFYYKSGEEYVFCDRCGYNSQYEIINRDDYDKLGQNWKPKFKRTKAKGKGCFKYGTGALSCGAFSKQSDYKEFEKMVASHNSETNNIDNIIKTANYSFKKKGVWYIKDVISGKVDVLTSHNQIRL